MRVNEMTVHHDVMTCPACDEMIQADATIQPELGEPTLAPGGGKVNLTATASLRRFRIRHECKGRVEAEQFIGNVIGSEPEYDPYDDASSPASAREKLR